ncbi:MAG: hypothetical protein JNK95_10680 [Candidatus Competibacter sp.]|nr:hypothetical protein [Candidatus Competibacter sp.]MDG4605952.1 hypothetical protein [Candidatus Contendobacter sp.]HRD50389.1 hypothetical protein [Candidatus Contendobacter sp.]
MKKLALVMAVISTLCSFTAFGAGSMTGVEVPFETLSKIEPNTVFIVISDEKGVVKIVKVNHNSIPIGEPFLRVSPNSSDTGQPQGGCWVRINGLVIWMDPCPY